LFSGRSKVEYLTAKVERGDIHDVVEATGTINAVRTVLVGSQVSGTIAKLYVDFNSSVRRGDLIATIDPALFQGALDQAIATLHSAQAQLDKDQANLVFAKVTLERSATLARQDSIALTTVDNAKSLYEQAMAQIELDKAAILQNEAAVSVAKTNLAYTTIRSPVDGIVVARNVDVGQTVAASLQAPTIFTIAQDLTKTQVYVNTDESDVGRIKLGRGVTFKVDAYPKEIFQGVVSQIRMNATTVQNVVTYNTIVDFANPDMRLFPGMTAFVTIPVATVQNVTKVPNTALRFKPALAAAKLEALYAKYGIGADGPSAEDGSAGRRSQQSSVIVWKNTSGGLEPVEFSPGITDHAYTEVKRVIKGPLSPSDDLVTAVLEAKNSP